MIAKKGMNVHNIRSSLLSNPVEHTIPCIWENLLNKGIFAIPLMERGLMMSCGSGEKLNHQKGSNRRIEIIFRPFHRVFISQYDNAGFGMKRIARDAGWMQKAWRKTRR